MKRWVRVAAALAACVFLSGCAASRPEARKEEPPGVSVRLPVAEAATLNIESQPPLGHPELPLSVADESRGRWLTLFEVNYSPVTPPLPLPPSIEEGPSR
jgi:hypothetical protein